MHRSSLGPENVQLDFDFPNNREAGHLQVRQTNRFYHLFAPYTVS